MAQSSHTDKLKTLLLYWSATGNTEKVANTIRDTLVHAGIKPIIKKIAEASDVELYDYDLVFLGAPSYSFQPPEPVQKYIKAKMKLHVERGISNLDVRYFQAKPPSSFALIPGRIPASGKQPPPETT